MLDAGAQPQWRLLPTPDFDLRSLFRNPAHGLAAVLADSGGDGTLVVYAVRPDQGP